MRAARVVVVGLVILLVVTGCGGGLSDAETVWCRRDRDRLEFALIDLLYGGSLDTFYESPLGSRFAGWHTAEEREGDWNYVEEHFPSEYGRACKVAYELAHA